MAHNLHFSPTYKKVLEGAQRIVNVTRIVDELKAAIEIVDDIRTKFNIAMRDRGPGLDSVTHSYAITSDIWRHKTLNSTQQIKAENIPRSDKSKEQEKSQEVCSETFYGTTHGYPFYDTGWEITNCSYGKPVAKLLTVVIIVDDIDIYNRNIRPSIIDLHKVYPKLKIELGIPYHVKKDYRPESDFISTTFYSLDENMGKTLNRIVKKIKTPYTFIANNLIEFTKDINFERLIREINLLNVSVIGGAITDQDGIWSLNCHQMAFRNYTLVYRTGYHQSMHSCIFCNFTEGPFLSRTAFLQSQPFSENLSGQLVQRDYLFNLNVRLGQRAAVCPDVMFHVMIGNSTPVPHPKGSQVSEARPGGSQVSFTRSELLDFARKWNVHRLVLENGQTYEFSCEELKTGCNIRTGRILHPFFLVFCFFFSKM